MIIGSVIGPVIRNPLGDPLCYPDTPAPYVEDLSKFRVVERV